jgi:hypothetical protein
MSNVEQSFIAISSEIIKILDSIDVNRVVMIHYKMVGKPKDASVEPLINVEDVAHVNPSVVIQKIQDILKLLRLSISNILPFIVRVYDMSESGMIDLTNQSGYDRSISHIEEMFRQSLNHFRTMTTDFYMLVALEDQLQHCVQCAIDDCETFNHITNSAFGDNFMRSCQ